MNYDTTLTSTEVDARLRHFAIQSTTNLVKVAPTVILEQMGGEERILTRMTRFAEHARPYLSMTPRDRLVAVVSHWMDVLQTVRDDADDIERAMDAELLMRVSEVADRIRHGDMDGAFDVLRSASNPRPDDTNPILLPDTLDLTSACWVDLDPVN